MEMDKERGDQLGKLTNEILLLLQTAKIKNGEASGVLGAAFASLVLQTEENFPFISFWNSFTRTYSFNYSGDEIHEVAKCKRMEDYK